MSNNPTYQVIRDDRGVKRRIAYPDDDEEEENDLVPKLQNMQMQRRQSRTRTQKNSVEQVNPLHNPYEKQELVPNSLITDTSQQNTF